MGRDNLASVMLNLKYVGNIQVERDIFVFKCCQLGFRMGR